MKTLYESIFDDDNTIIKNTDESIVKMIKDTLKLSKNVKINFNGPELKLNLLAPQDCSNASAGMFKPLPIDVRYEYMDKMFLFVDGYHGYTPIVEHCKYLEVADSRYIDKVDIRKVDVISVRYFYKRNNNDKLFDFVGEHKPYIFYFNLSDRYYLTEDDMSKISEVPVSVIYLQHFPGLTAIAGKVKFEKQTSVRGRNLVERLKRVFNAYFSNKKHGRLCVNNGYKDYYEISKVGDDYVFSYLDYYAFNELTDDMLE